MIKYEYIIFRILDHNFLKPTKKGGCTTLVYKWKTKLKKEKVETNMLSENH